MTTTIEQLYTNYRFASDISNNFKQNGDVYNDEVIKQNIQNIITTLIGTRLFRPSYGCTVELHLFENMDAAAGENLLNKITSAIKKWEKRVRIDESNMRMEIRTDENALFITIPFISLVTGKSNNFEMKI